MIQVLVSNWCSPAQIPCIFPCYQEFGPSLSARCCTALLRGTLQGVTYGTAAH
jgi:hypothetical protein